MNKHFAWMSADVVSYITAWRVSDQHAAAMKMDIIPPLPCRTLCTITIWLIALLIMSACSTAIHPVSSLNRQEAVKSTDAVQTSPLPVETRKLAVPLNINVLQKKQQFFDFMKPIVMAENKNILQQRQYIIYLQGKPRLSSEEKSQLRHLTAQYHLPISMHPGNGLWRALLNRVDIIPLKLALVQAANESAWGRSRFAREGNNYFGQWCFRKGCGIVPNQRLKGASYEVRRFANATESVRAYMININTSPAYVALRQQRQLLRKRNATIKAEILANELQHYSQRGMAYVDSIRSMIRSNRELIAQAKASSIIQAD